MIKADPIRMLVWEIMGIWLFIICGIICFHLGFLSDWWAAITQVFLFLVVVRVILIDIGYVRFKGRHFISCALILIFSYIIEVVGVNTGRPFGNYNYTPELGVVFLNVPLIIPLAWLNVVVCAANIARMRSLAYTMLMGGLLICMFDIALEPAAKVLNLWNFDGGSAPLRNYLSWGVFGAFLILLRRVTAGEAWNRAPSKLYLHIFLAQIVYFIAILA